MAFNPWGTFPEAQGLREAVHSLLQEGVLRASGERTAASLLLDVAETANEFIVKASLPGVKHDDLQVTAHGDTITIRGESLPEPDRPDQTWLLRERRFGPFQRSFALPTPIDADKAQARFENGVLTLTLPKAETAKPKHIKVGGGMGF